MVTLVNRAKVNTSTTGTGTISLGTVVAGYQTFSAAGVANGNVVRYVIEDGAEWEIGTGTYTTTGSTLTRTVSESSNAGAAISLTGGATVFVGLDASDIVQTSDIGVTVQAYDANIVSDGAYVHTDNNYTTAEKSKLAGVEAGATGDQTASEILTAVKTVDGAASGLDADLLDGQHGSYYYSPANAPDPVVTLAGAITGAGTLTNLGNVTITTTATSDPTLTLAGDVTGTATFTNLGNATLTAVVADDSHNHIIANVDGLQTALDNKLDDSQKGAVNGLAELDATGRVPSAQLPSYVDDVLEYASAAGFPVTGETGKLYVALDSNDVYRWTGSAYVKVSDAVTSADQATKLATTRNIALSGDVSGSANFDGSANITITATVADDSHNHIIANVDGLQTALDGKSPTSHLHTGVYEPADATILKDADIGVTVQGYSAALAGTTASYTTAEKTKLAGIETGATADQTAAEILTAIKTVDGAASGLDADLLDGLHASSFLQANQTITLSGDATGSGTTSIVVTVADDSHNHIISNVDGLQTALDGKSPTSHTHTAAQITDFDTEVSNNTSVAANTAKVSNATHTGEVTGSTALTIASNVVDADNLKVTGNGTTSQYLRSDGDGSFTWATPPDTTVNQTITLSGDATGSGTTSIVVTVADDSHNHIISNVDGLQAALDGKLSTTGKAADSNLLDGLNSTSFLRGDTTDTFTTLNGSQIGIGAGAVITESTDRADLLKITSTTSSWGGIQISNSSNEFLWSFMGDGTTGGIYDDLSNAWHIQFIDGGETRLYHAGAEKLNTLSTGIQITGTVTATDFNTTSDISLKDNVTDIDGALDKVCNLRGVEFDWKATGVHTVGFIAQEVEAIVPELVDTNEEDGIKSVKYGNVTALLVEAVKELRLEIADLKQQLANHA